MPTKTTPPAPAHKPRRATIFYDDGRVEEVPFLRPLVIHEASLLGDAPSDTWAGFRMCWIASGRPGDDGDPKHADDHVRAWLEGIDEIQIPPDLADTNGDPPTRSASKT